MQIRHLINIKIRNKNYTYKSNSSITTSKFAKENHVIVHLGLGINIILQKSISSV